MNNSVAYLLRNSTQRATKYFFNQLMSGRKTRREGWVDWRNHPAKEIIQNDFLVGGIFYEALKENKEIDLKVLFLTYTKSHPNIFEEVQFSQFQARVNDYVTRFKVGHQRSIDEEAWMAHDRSLHPRQVRNTRGELVFDLHQGKQLLRDDVKNGRHIGVLPRVFRMSRPEYCEFPEDIFRQRIYQEIRFRKYCNHLEDQRKKKQEEFANKQREKREKAAAKAIKEAEKAEAQARKAAEKAEAQTKKVAAKAAAQAKKERAAEVEKDSSTKQTRK